MLVQILGLLKLKTNNRKINKVLETLTYWSPVATLWNDQSQWLTKTRMDHGTIWGVPSPKGISRGGSQRAGEAGLLVEALGRARPVSFPLGREGQQIEPHYHQTPFSNSDGPAFLFNSLAVALAPHR